MSGEDRGAWGRAWSRARARFEGFTQLPSALLLSAVAALVLVVGSLLPWFTYEGGLGDDYILGIEGMPGALTLLVGIVAIALLANLARRGEAVDPGGVAALGLLAVALVAAELIHVRQSDFQALGWGLVVAAAGAAFLLIGGFFLMGGPEERPDS